MPFDKPLPEYLSPSKLNDFSTCYRKYQYGAIDRIPSKAAYPLVKGRIVHAILEKLFGLQGAERTIEAARTFIDGAKESELTDQTKEDLGYDEALEAVLDREIRSSIEGYFKIESPAEVNAKQAEFQMKATIAETPLFGILDRLDEAEDGSLTIVDYKTGRFPRGQFYDKRFENMEIYAALFKETHKVRPVKLRLIYVEAGQSDEKDVVGEDVNHQIGRASAAWRLINRFYQEGNFEARPSSSCRWCPYTAQCRESGVKVPVSS